MEQIFPRIVFAELFRKGYVEAAKENLPILDRFGHALRWGSLKDHDLNIAVHHASLRTHNRFTLPIKSGMG
jgi:hypothetical protein